MLKSQTGLIAIVFTSVSAILLVASASTAVSQTITVTAGTSETIASHLYGVNGQQRNDDLWDQQSNPSFNSALASLNLSVLRFPTGTGANYWDWSVGDFDGYYVNAASTYQSQLSELQNELSSAGSQAQVDFILNVLTDPTNCTISQWVNGTSGKCLTPTPSSPNFTYQIHMLQHANQTNLSIPFVELGNEFWNTGTCNEGVYPSGTSSLDQGGYNYATAIVNGNWSSQIRSTDTGVQISAIANYQPPQLTGDNRRIYWNESFFTASPLPDVDALTIHIYRNSDISGLSGVTANLPFNGPGNRSDVVKTMLAVPFHTQDDLATNYLNDNVNNSATHFQQLQSSGYEKSIWVTEYNMKEPSYAVNGSWAHGLATAAMGLKFLENVNSHTCSPTCAARVTMAIQHETLGSAYFGEIFDSTNGFGSGSSGSQNPPVPMCAAAAGNGGPPITPAVNISTIQYALTAVGLTQEQINLATAGQTSAAPLTFSPNAPLINDPTQSTYTYPSLYGWKFSGSVSVQTIILNLGGLSQTLNVNALAPNGGTYSQINGDPGVYYQGYNGSTYKASYEDSNGPGGTDEAVSDPLTVAKNQTLGSSLVLPPYSITRIVSN